MCCSAGTSTVHRTRQRFVDERLLPALSARLRPGQRPGFDQQTGGLFSGLGVEYAAGGLYDSWRIAGSNSSKSRRFSTIWSVASLKNDLKPWQRREWCIPSVSPDYVWHIEDVLDLYAEPDDPWYPQVCFDESPVQLTSETRLPLPARPGQPARHDSEYKREGTANLFLFVQPLQGWRQVNVTQQRTTKQDFAQPMRLLVDGYFPAAERIRRVMDHLNTPTPAALYGVFPPAEACRITRKLAFHYTPKQGGWLNRAECEWAVLAGQCLDRRIPNIETLREEIAA